MTTPRTTSGGGTSASRDPLATGPRKAIPKSSADLGGATNRDPARTNKPTAPTAPATGTGIPGAGNIGSASSRTASGAWTDKLGRPVGYMPGMSTVGLTPPRARTLGASAPPAAADPAEPHVQPQAFGAQAGPPASRSFVGPTSTFSRAMNRVARPDLSY